MSGNDGNFGIPAAALLAKFRKFRWMTREITTFFAELREREGKKREEVGGGSTLDSAPEIIRGSP